MKLSLPVIFIITLLYSCSSADKRPKSNANELIYSAADTIADGLSAAGKLIANTGTRELGVQIKLSNSGPGSRDIQEISITTAEGLRAIPITAPEHFLLQQGKDTTVLLKVRPLSDLKLYQSTGLQGNFKPAYTAIITYQRPGTGGLNAFRLTASANKPEYAAYLDKNKTPVTGYSFDTKTAFNEQEKKYLLSLKAMRQPPFVYLSAQEIAVAGLNFRLKSYYRQDTLHAELAIVNHAEFPVKIIRDAFDITTGGNPSAAGAKTIIIEKASGAQQHQQMMEKGDRVVIHFKKYLKIKSPGEGNVTLSLHNSFMLSGRKALFNRDVQLLPTQF